MSYRVPILLLILLCAIAGSRLPSAFASSADVCDHHDEFEVFRCGIENKCHHSLLPRPPLEVDGDLLDSLMDSNLGNAFTSILFYTSRCQFSRAVRPKFDVLSSMFPHIRHLVVEQSQALPSVFSRYGIHSLPSILMVNQTFRIRYHGQKDLASLIQFYQLTTGLKPVQYVDEGEPTSLDIDGNLITWLQNGSSIKEIAERDPYLVLALVFLSLKLAILISPIMGARLKALWASYAPHLSLGILGETSQLFGRAMHMIDVRRLWIKLRLAKTRNFQERAKNALASVSLGKSTSQSG
ncbi:5'-adenylylsulfate reductase-like 7 isoform X1 [Brassica rapa]|uniref:Thioredoxin domain-containing protein n=2 Tax=Brassica campestris TaxID=3711 RepID=M4CD54_BRACM|nr:5'-adenylylsulfate reductase-like 7 isoform X1 [Brassica rapa]XP_009121011.1 5'-adenylylsulfate reductase-like 7 isoform X1 [Brassica rapa]XP_009121012.1 5'-adenylylsulfate reductase-like 7 isoform X1 [Brassica rapa]